MSMVNYGSGEGDGAGYGYDYGDGYGYGEGANSDGKATIIESRGEGAGWGGRVQNYAIVPRNTITYDANGVRGVFTGAGDGHGGGK